MRSSASSQSRSVRFRLGVIGLGVALAGSGFAGTAVATASAQTPPTTAGYTATAGDPQAALNDLAAAYNRFAGVASAHDMISLVGGAALGYMATSMATGSVAVGMPFIPIVGTSVALAVLPFASVALVPGTAAGTIVAGQNSTSPEVRAAADDVIAKLQVLQHSLGL